MNNTKVGPVELSRQKTALQIYLLKTTLPLKTGGSLVFPGGLIGGGYRLDEWQFDRYRASLEKTYIGEEGRRRRRWAFGGAVLFGLFAGALIITATFVLTDPEKIDAVGGFLIDHTGFSLALFSLALVATLALLFYPMFRRIRKFREDFPGAPRLSQRAHLSQRMLGHIVRGNFNPGVFLAFAVGWSVIGLAFIALGIVSTQLAPWQSLIGMAYLLLAAAFGAPYWVHRSFHRRHGRAPTAEDLELM